MGLVPGCPEGSHNAKICRVRRVVRSGKPGGCMEQVVLGEVRLGYDGRGLIPVVVQQVGTGEVLMVAWANEEAQ